MELVIGALIGYTVLFVNAVLPIENQFLRTTRNSCYYDYKTHDKDVCYTKRIEEQQQKERDRIIKGLN